MSWNMFVTSLKPANDFEDLQEIEAKVGMHIKGDVNYALDCFAYEETWTENKNGTRTPAKTSHYYYVIPGNEKFLGLEVSTEAKEAMENLADETVEYLNGGEQPTTKVAVEGRMSEMDEKMQSLFKEYLEEIGYTSDEIENMGEFLYIQQPDSMIAQQVFFGVGAFLVLLALIFIILIFYYRKGGRDLVTD